MLHTLEATRTSSHTQAGFDFPTENYSTVASVVSDIPSEKIGAVGSSGLSDSELLAIVLADRDGVEKNRALAAYLLKESGSLRQLASWSSEELQSIPGISERKAARILSTFELTRRIPHADHRRPCFSDAGLIAAYFAPIVLGLSTERFWVCLLDRKNHLIRREEISVGTATNALVHPREVFRTALRSPAGVTAIVCVHNHPSSGDPTPSASDIAVTRTLREASRTLDVQLLDHVIIGEAARDPAGLGYYSFRRAGLI